MTTDPMTGGDPSAGDAVPLYVEIQQYLDGVTALIMAEQTRFHEPSLCPECRVSVVEYDDHLTGCPLWGARPEDF